MRFGILFRRGPSLLLSGVVFSFFFRAAQGWEYEHDEEADEYRHPHRYGHQVLTGHEVSS